MRRRIALSTLVALPLLGGCQAGLSPARFASSTPVFSPEAFFAGATSSTGVMENRAGAPLATLVVTGTGTPLPGGRLRLVQTIRLGDAPPRERTWMLTRLSDHRYAASLTDATGPVTVEAYGGLMHLTYPMKSPRLGRMEQWLYLQPDGRTVVNEATVTIMGVVVARLSERIGREAGPPPGDAGRPPAVSGPGSRSGG